MRRSKSVLNWVVQVSTVLLVALWLVPSLGLLVSSLRHVDQIASTGWWKALFPSEQVLQLRTQADMQIREGDLFVITGNLFAQNDVPVAKIRAFGTSSREIGAFAPGATSQLRKGGAITLQANGDYRYEHTEDRAGKRGARVFVTALIPPQFTFDNYRRVLFSGSATNTLARAFFNTLSVTIPATILPIALAAFAAYALAWMVFPGRALVLACVVGLLVVPLHLALIPLLKLHLGIGIGKGYLGIWLAHTGFGLPLAIYLLRNYMAGLPREIIENARIDGASEFQIFTRIVLPLSFPALASFAIFQFLWTWNDLLVAKVFLIDASGQTTVMTHQIVEMLGTYGGDWGLLAAAAFVSMILPLVVFFTMQKYLVRGLLAGSVK
ncbi:MAG: carbohydrate ABC transporter permease [Pelagimonas sp.]|jgi:alpha-glucoside transport system permease protein|nr:carbohydrate ABC transporter permease [Pelagimonas sp.]